MLYFARIFFGRFLITGAAAIVGLMPVEFLIDEQTLVYGRLAEELMSSELKSFLFLDGEDRTLIKERRGDRQLRMRIARLAPTVVPVVPNAGLV